MTVLLPLLVLLAAPPAPKGARPPTQAEEEAAAARAFDSKEAREIGPQDAGPIPPPFRWKVSNIIREIPIDGIQTVNDTPVKLHGIVVKGRLADVIEELYINFLKAGLYVQPIEKQDQVLQQVQVTGLDSYRAISYTAMVDPSPDGTCLVMLGEANIGESTKTQLYRKMTKVGESDFAPMMPNAIGPTRVKIEGMSTLSFQVAASEADALKFYRDAFAKRGYTAGEGNVFKKAGEEIEVRTGRDKELLTVLLTLRLRSEDPIAVPLPP